MEKEFLNMKDFTSLFEITRQTAYKLIKEGIPHFRVGADYRFVKEECVQWFKENTNKKGDK